MAQHTMTATTAATLHAMMTRVFGDVFGAPSWATWRIVAKILSGLPLSAAEMVVFRQITGRTKVPTTVKELWLVCGRRAGKSQFVAAVAVFLSCFKQYALSVGERGIGMIVASDRRQAGVIRGYVGGLIHAVPMLEALIVNETKDSIELSTGISISIVTASYRAPRGFTVAFAIGDECAFWAVDDNSADPDKEILRAIRPALVPGGLLMMLSTPYWRRGELYRMHTEHFGKDDSNILVVQADTLTMNPSIDPAIIAAAYDADESSARAEFGALFRSDIEQFVSRETLAALVTPGVRERPPCEGIEYRGFCDPSGGSSDAMCLAIAHDEGRIAVLDVLAEVKPPFSAEATVRAFAAILADYRLDRVTGDAFGGVVFQQLFAGVGVHYLRSKRPKNQLYSDLLPLLTSGRVLLLDHPRAIAQLAQLERRPGPGRDVIDHAPNAHDDLANVIAGVLSVPRPFWVLRAEAEEAAEVRETDGEAAERFQRKRATAYGESITEAVMSGRGWFPGKQ